MRATPILLLVLCLAPGAKAQEMFLSAPRSARVMRPVEMPVAFRGGLSPLRDLPPDQIHDAYDADRNGVHIRLEATFAHESGVELTLPAFALRERPDAPWVWRVRWTPTRPGRWTGRLRLDAAMTRWRRQAEESFGPIAVADDRDAPGFLVAPGPAENPAYLRETRPDGGSRALWLFGACRAWVVKSDPEAGIWGADEGIDREKDLFPLLRSGGYNLLNQWMAPWEYMLVHHDRAEYWRRPGGEWARHPLPPNAPWSPWQWYDQGRARDFDALLEQCRDGALVRLLLSPLPHVALQNRSHPWNPAESNWTPEENPDRGNPEKCNGFSAFRAGMTVWDFLAADPAAPQEDWRSQLFDHQANFWRYLIARWGASPALGVWVLMDEMDGIGEVQSDWALKLGWWARPECDRWHANTLRLFRGELFRADGLRYAGDPYRRPLHSATTSYGGQAQRGANLDWDGGPPGARPDLMGWHWYPWWPYGISWSQAWGYVIDGVTAYSTAPIEPRPRLIGECGAPDRYTPQDRPSPIYPTLYHHLIWSSLFGGQAGTAMDWDDGKDFGELRWRRRSGAFSAENYPIDHVARIEALRRFLGDLSPEDLQSCLAAEARLRVETAPAARPSPAIAPNVSAPPPATAPRVLALCARTGPPALYGWLYAPEESVSFTVRGLGEGEYLLTWYDPWTGRPIPGLNPQSVRANALDPGNQPCLKVDAAPALRALRAGAPPFLIESRMARGDDAAFKLLPR